MIFTLLRRRTRRTATMLLATAVASGAIAANATVAGAADEAPAQVQTFEPDDFSSQADQVPPELGEVIDSDLGLTPEEYFADAAAARAAAEVVQELRSAGIDVNAAEIDGQEVTIYVGSEADVEAVEATGAKVVVGEPEKPTGLEKREVSAAADLKGGFGWLVVDDVTSPTSGGRCSAGLNGTSGGALVNFTAGHCAADFPASSPVLEFAPETPVGGTADWTFDDIGEPIGTTGPMHFGESNDGGLFNISEAGWEAPPTVSTWGGGMGNKNDGEVKVYDAAVPIVGQPACKSGASGGWTCGKVLFESDTLELDEGTTVQAFIFSACLLDGDSGGSIMSGNYALGVDSFSTGATSADPMSTCDEWSAATSYDEGGFADGDFSGGFAMSSDFPGNNGEDLFGDAFDLTIFVGTPKVKTPEDGAETNLRPTLSGTVGAAKGAKVTIKLSGADSRTLTATVGANGKWSVQVARDLPEGDYTYTAVASHTANGASVATSGGTATGSFTAVEPEIEPLVVKSPSDGQTVASGNQRPSFKGTGHPGGTVTLTVDDESYGSAGVAADSESDGTATVAAADGTATVNDDGTWTIKPSKDLPAGVRFDATVTQRAEGDKQSVSIASLGIKVVPGVKIDTPANTSDETSDVVFTGSAHPDTKVTLELTTDGGESVELEGTFAMDDDGNWTFTPDEALPDGKYILTAVAEVPGGDKDLSRSTDIAEFTIVTDGELPDTGAGNASMALIGLGLLVAGAGLLTVRALRGRRVT